MKKQTKGNTIVYAPLDYFGYDHFFHSLDNINTHCTITKIITLINTPSLIYNYAKNRIIDYTECSTTPKMMDLNPSLIILFDMASSKYKSQTQRIISEGLFYSIPIINVKEHIRDQREKPLSLKMPKKYEGHIKPMQWDRLALIQEYDRIPMRI